MAYSSNQKKQHIIELQRYLQAISYVDENIPHVIPDCFYGKETAAAVKAFQREHGLPETGNTDFTTWNKIVSIYKSNLDLKPLALDIFPSADYVVKQGDRGLLVYIIEAILNDMSTKYDNMTSLNVTGEFDESTVKAVKNFQNKIGLPQTGTVGSNTWNMLVRTAEHVNQTLPQR